MDILVLIKPTPEADTRLRPDRSGRELDPEGVKWVLAGYDESAVEQALLLKEGTPNSRVRGISFGPPPRTEEILRAALALGCDVATWVESPGGLVTDPLLVARVLAAAIRKYPFDLILCGKQASDDESGIVPSALGALLAIPAFGGVVDLRWSEVEKRFRLQRVVEDAVESWEAPAPCVIGLQEAWNDPRTAKLPNILKSRKAPIEKIPAAESWSTLGEASEWVARAVQFLMPPPRTGAKMIDYKSPEEAAQKLVRILREEAKVFP